jgi:hypothetical protein
MHLKPTAGCQISTLIFEIKLWRGIYKYPIKICQGRQSSCPLLAKLKVLRTLTSLTYFYGIFIETPLHNLFSNIKVDI